MLPALLVALAVLGGALAPAGASTPLTLLHLSDIHFSTNAQATWASFGDREGDARLFAQHLLPRLAPSAVLITGDLVDARGAGLQQEVEWRVSAWGSAWVRGLAMGRGRCVAAARATGTRSPTCCAPLTPPKTHQHSVRTVVPRAGGWTGGGRGARGA